VTVNGAYFGEMTFRNLARPLRYEGTQTEFRVEKTPGEIRLARGYLNASNLTGPVVLTSKSKDVQINGFTDSMEISLERGDVELRPGKLPVPKMEVKTRNGTIDLALPDGAKFDLRATVQKGEVQNDYGSPLHAETEGRGGSIRGSSGDGPTVVLNADRGNVTVRKGGTYAEARPPSVPPPPMPPRPREIQ
jgi:hypothetical protein